MLDPEDGLLKQLLLPFKLGVGGPLAGGGQYMPWIHVDDEVRLLLWALDTDRASGAYNATAPNPVTNREFSKALGRVLGRPAVLPLPKLALKLRFGGELGEIIAGGQRVVPATRPRRRLRVPPPGARAGAPGPAAALSAVRAREAGSRTRAGRR